MRTLDETPLQIDEAREGKAWTRLTLRGELDLATAGLLRDRVGQLKRVGSHVRLDLSQLDFIDSAGAHAVAEAVAESRADHWHFVIEPRMSSQVRRSIELINGAGWNLDI